MTFELSFTGLIISSVPWLIGSLGERKGQFSWGPLPVFSAGGPCEQLWHGQGGMSTPWCCPSSIFSADHGIAHPPRCPGGCFWRGCRGMWHAWTMQVSISWQLPEEVPVYPQGSWSCSAPSRWFYDKTKLTWISGELLLLFTHCWHYNKARLTPWISHVLLLSLSLNWLLATLWLTDELSQSAPMYKHASLDKKQKMWPSCFWKQQWSTLGLCRSISHFELTWCCLLHLSQRAELSASWQEVNWFFENHAVNP